MTQSTPRETTAVRSLKKRYAAYLRTGTEVFQTDSRLLAWLYWLVNKDRHGVVMYDRRGWIDHGPKHWLKTGKPK